VVTVAEDAEVHDQGGILFAGRLRHNVFSATSEPAGALGIAVLAVDITGPKWYGDIKDVMQMPVDYTMLNLNKLGTPRNSEADLIPPLYAETI